MAKIWRRKRKGKYIGSWHVLVAGKPVNLQTQDARKANARARLALRGKWPEQKTVASDAAAAAAPAQHADYLPSERANSGNETAASAPPPPDAPREGAETDAAPAEAAQAAAAEACANEPDEQAEGERAEIRAALEELFRSSGEHGDIGDFVAAAQISIEYLIASTFASRMRPPRVIAAPTSHGLSFRALAIGWRLQLKRWETLLDEITPGKLIAIGTVASIASMLSTARKAEPAESPPPGAGGVP